MTIKTPDRVHVKLTDGQLGIIISVTAAVFGFFWNFSERLTRVEEKLSSHMMYCPVPDRRSQSTAKMEWIRPDPITIKEEED